MNMTEKARIAYKAAIVASKKANDLASHEAAALAWANVDKILRKAICEQNWIESAWMADTDEAERADAEDRPMRKAPNAQMIEAMRATLETVRENNYRHAMAYIAATRAAANA